jgi:hypothetical protein
MVTYRVVIENHDEVSVKAACFTVTGEWVTFHDTVMKSDASHMVAAFPTSRVISVIRS